MDTVEQQNHLVVVGASAGGIDALSVLASTLPKDFPAPIVVAQHLDPRRRSHLEDILRRRTELTVRTVSGREALHPGTLFVVPADRHVEITDHEVRVVEAHGAGPRPSVDRLLSTAAERYGEGLIAVILSGTGSDGANGARAVKNAGGMVIVQDPATATFPSMPASLSPTTVDVVAALEAIGPLLSDVISGSYTPAEETDDALLVRFLEQIRDRSGIDFSAYKRPTILRRLQRRMLAVRASTLQDYIRYVNRNPDEFERLSSSFLIKVTEFFRDPDLFAHLRDTVLPDIAADAQAHHRPLRIWSAGCATGEEAYSLAILVSEYLENHDFDQAVRVFATDLDNDAINFARRGIYPASALSALTPQQIDRYFTRRDGEYEIRKQVRSLTVFGQHDLAQRAPFPRIDLVVSRNVLIYFTPELQKRALHLFAFSLREGGYLVLGKAETTSPLGDYFVLEQPRLKVFRREGAPTLVPPERIGYGPIPRASARVTRSLAAARPVDPPERDRSRSPAERAEAILLRIPHGTVVVDAKYDIGYINSAARQLLGIHVPAIDEDFVHVARLLPSDALRSALDAALKGEEQTFDVELRSGGVRGARRTLQITARPFRIGDDDSPHVLVAVDDVSRVVDRRRAGDERATEQEQRLAELEDQVTSLSRTNAELLEANKELSLSNAEMRSSNEELMIGTEEVQAATEEVETLNEELQATNEELETLNEELQATVEELKTTNDDLEARTLELEEMAASEDAQGTGAGARSRTDGGDGSVAPAAPAGPSRTRRAAGTPRTDGRRRAKGS